jgi:hypothetical protein
VPRILPPLKSRFWLRKWQSEGTFCLGPFDDPPLLIFIGSGHGSRSLVASTQWHRQYNGEDLKKAKIKEEVKKKRLHSVQTEEVMIFFVGIEFIKSMRKCEARTNSKVLE